MRQSWSDRPLCKEMGKRFTQEYLQDAVLASFFGEVRALKPGNVSVYAAGHGMVYEDFVRSGEVSAPILCDPRLCLGQRILQAVRATEEAAACNTNLGMLLLFTPLIMAGESLKQGENLRPALAKLLVALQKCDADEVFEAIVQARPGGLGHVEKYDVHSTPETGLVEAMAAARDRDFIALQYSNGFQEVFDVGLAAFHEYKRAWNSVEWATVGCYLTFLSRYPDTHILRKFGADIAERVKVRAATVLKQFDNNKSPDSAKSLLLEYDRELKDSKINPGTSADLAAASLLLYTLGI